MDSVKYKVAKGILDKRDEIKGLEIAIDPDYSPLDGLCAFTRVLKPSNPEHMRIAYEAVGAINKMIAQHVEKLDNRFKEL